MNTPEEFRRVHRLTPLLKFWTVLLAVFAVVLVNTGLSDLAQTWRWLQEGQFLLLAGAVGGFLLACAVVWFGSQVWWQAMGYRLGAEELALRQGVLSKQLRTARRREVLARARTENIPAPPEQAETPALIPEIPILRSLSAAALQISTLLAGLFTVVLVLSPLGWATVIPALLGIVPVVWNQIDRSWLFTARLDADPADPVLHVSFGLADRRRQSIPLARIHGVTLHQPWLWRIPGWYSVGVSVAGYGAGTKGATTQILPVGTREQVARLLAVVSPVPDPEAQPPTFTSPERARWVSPVDLHQQSVTVLPEAVITRSGRFSRRTNVIAQNHIQELSLVRGPLQQLFGLCTVRLDLVPGPVRMSGEDLTPQDAHALLNRLRQRELPAYTPPGKPS